MPGADNQQGRTREGARMKYEACLVNRENGYVSPTPIPVQGISDEEVITNFKKCRQAHGDNSLLILKLMKINDSGEKIEIIVP